MTRRPSAPDARIAELVRTLRAAEQELQALTGGQLDAVVGGGDDAYLLQEAQQRLRATEAAQRQLAASQTAILDALPAHVALVDANGVILTVNESWRRFAAANLLQSPEFAVGQNYLAICEHASGDCAEESREAAAGIRRVLTGQAPMFTLEYPCHSPTEQRWFRLMISPLRAGAGGGAVIMHVDITARKLAELALRASEQQFAKAFQFAPIGVALVSLDGRYFAANRAFCGIVGYAAAELLGKSFEEITHPEDLAADQANEQRLMDGVTNAYQIEKRYIRKDGEHVWVLLSVSLVRNDAGEPVHFISQVLDQTEHRQASKALHIQAHMLDQIGQAVITTDMQGTITFANRYSGELNGWTPSEMLGRSIMDVAIPKASKSPAEAIMEQLRHGQTWHGEFMARHRDGREFPVLSTISPILDETGQPAGIIGVSIDISERKQAEATLARLAAIVESSDDAIMGKDLDGVITSWNRGAERVFGFTAAEMVGRSIQPLIPEGADNDEDALVEPILRGESVGRIETRRVTKEGRLIDVSITMSPIRDEAGTVIGLAKIARDITERNAEEARRLATERRFRRLVESNAQGVLFFTFSGAITDANDALLQLLGYTREELAAGTLKWTELTPPQYGPLDQQALGELAAHGVVKPYEKEYMRRDGSRVPVLIGAARFEDQPDEGVAFVVDLTERKKLEQQFMRAQRMESLGTLAGGIAHDLNNVLAPILMSVELLKEINPSTENTEILNTLQISAVRGADLVKQVLSFARGVTGDRVSVAFSHLMRDLVKVMRDTFPKSIDVHLESAHDLWSVTGDPTQLHQVFLNLCVNARDAMPHGGRLQLSMENVVLDDIYTALNPDAQAGAFVVVTVADSGTGIPSALREQIFEPFFTTKELGKGTGLGLSTTMAIVKSHGGFINLYSEMGKGTKFKVYLPANTTAALADNVAIAQSGLPRGHGELVLVVDDEDGVREIARRTLERYGYRVALAANGAEAVAIYAQHGADIAVVLTDMAMPIMDGPALIVALRAMNPAVTIIGSSGLTSNHGIARALGAGVAQFVPKPYTARVLLTTLRAAIAGEGPAQSPHRH
ncbi:MAG: PAS domain S-box protein [Acidobacteriota bacterium]|nr:PAS domain S-box protein [Acidobacteriota bacterium]